MVQGSRFRVLGSRFRVLGSRFRVLGGRLASRLLLLQHTFVTTHEHTHRHQVALHGFAPSTFPPRRSHPSPSPRRETASAGKQCRLQRRVVGCTRILNARSPASSASSQGVSYPGKGYEAWQPVRSRLGMQGPPVVPEALRQV